MKRRTFLQALGLVAVAPRLALEEPVFLPYVESQDVPTRVLVADRYFELKRRKERELIDRYLPIDWRKAQMQRALAWERLLAGCWADTSPPLVKRPIEMLEDGTYRYADTKMVRGVVSSEVGDAWFNGEPGFGHADR